MRNYFQMAIVNEKSDKMLDKSEHNTINLYNIAAKILKDVKIGKNYKTLLYKSQYPVKYLFFFLIGTRYLYVHLFYQILQ